MSPTERLAASLAAIFWEYIRLDRRAEVRDLVAEKFPGLDLDAVVHRFEVETGVFNERVDGGLVNPIAGEAIRELGDRRRDLAEVFAQFRSGNFTMHLGDDVYKTLPLATREALGAHVGECAYCVDRKDEAVVELCPAAVNIIAAGIAIPTPTGFATGIAPIEQLVAEAERCTHARTEVSDRGSRRCLDCGAAL